MSIRIFFMIALTLLLVQNGWTDQGGRKAERRDFVVSERDYPLPALELRDQDDRPIDLAALRSAQDRTIISFIFTSCAGICPMITANMVRSIPLLDQVDENYRIVLISVDPEHDTPSRLKAYSERFDTGPKISFLTGSSEQVFQVLRQLDAVYEGANKMNHQPVTLSSRGTEQGWRRIDGLIGADTVVQQYREVVDAGAAAG
jgi:cytochrome oxidase Cu insertion factor (SCO1/SenC/PrrC family)